MEFVRTGFWFVPLLMLLGAFALAAGLLHLDEMVDPGIKSTLDWAYTGGPEGARSLLSTVAGSMITAASVTFSLASVALSISSQQYGSRVLRNFMRDRITQVLLGTFVSTFLYCVLVVRTIRGSDQSGGFVPAISVTVAIALAVGSLVLLILFIHHVSASIQASHIVRVIAEEMQAAIPKLYPSETGEGQREGQPGEFRQGPSMSLVLDKGGYLQTIDLDTLMEVATAERLLVEVTIKPGDHVVDGGAMATLWGRDAMAEEPKKKLAESFYFGGERTAAQDIRYQFQQLTDVVVRALSPGINDPFTAINGIDALGSGLVGLAKRPEVKPVRKDDKGVSRLYVPTAELCEVLDETVGHIGIYGAGDGFVLAALRRVLEAVEPYAGGAADRETVARLRRELDAREQAKRKEAGVA